MKRNLILVLTLFLAVNINAQNEFNTFNSLKGSKLLEECNNNGKSTSSTKLVPYGSKFTIVGSNEDNYIIKFWKWDNNIKDGKQKNENFVFDKSTKNKRYFLLPKSDKEVYTRKYVRGYAPVYGVTTLPFKYRPKTNDFTKDLTLSGLGGFKFNFSSEMSLALVVGTGLATVSVDSLSTHGNIKTTQDYAAISVPVGLVYEWEKLQFGLFVGWDWLSSNEINWVNNGKTWFGVGIGYSIFNSEKAKTTEGVN